MRLKALLISSLLATSVACHPGPVLNTGAQPPDAGGTVAGIVSASDPQVAVPGRKVTVINTTSGQKFETTTAVNGGYTIQVPAGTYRIEIELRDGERLSKQPDETRVNNGDLDSARDFVITATRD